MTNPTDIEIKPTDSVPPMPLDLGRGVARVLGATAKASPFRWRIDWTGSKIPRGVEIFGCSIAWAQHGRLLDAEGECFGFYSREETFSGVKRDHHSIIVWSRK